MGGLICREVPISIFHFGGGCQFRGSLQLCSSGVVFLRACIHGVVCDAGFVSVFNLCFGFDLPWFGKLVEA